MSSPGRSSSEGSFALSVSLLPFAVSPSRVLPVGPVLHLTKLFLPWWMVFGKELFGVLLKLLPFRWFFFFKFQIDWVSPSQLLAGLPRPRMLGLLWLSGPVWFRCDNSGCSGWGGQIWHARCVAGACVSCVS
ncbi:hypothetical protein Nepgr_033629 [Nepenthes gracilis]|uniref:Uncharacterized protein n=1 Tax=Nepenthes gracilis TaxID=150966 RepID=A0AAD3Y8I7_NEPGR|nr:hypothetical protein Nepgr_033629 [Nepenthes gracilis]